MKKDKSQEYDDGLDEAGQDSAYDESGVADQDFFDEEAGAEESWDEESYDESGQEEDDLAAAPAKAKKKGGLFNVLLIGGAVLAGGAIFYFNFLATPSQPVPAAEVAQASMPAPTAPAATKEEVPVESPPAEIADIPEPVAVTDPVQATPPVEESGALLPVPDSAPVESASDSEPTEAVAAVPEPSGVSSIGLPSASDIMVKAPSVPAPAVDAGVAAPPSSADQDISGISDKLSVLIDRFDAIEERMGDFEKKIQASSQSGVQDESVVRREDLVQMQKHLARLEEKLSTLGSSPEGHPSASQKESTLPVAAPSKSPSSRRAESLPAPEKRVPRWVLKSAQPGSAMVSEASSGDVRVIAVGDTLPGIGKVMSVQLQGGLWVVQGTQGTITN